MTPHLSSDRDNFYHHWLDLFYQVSDLQHLPVQLMAAFRCRLVVLLCSARPGGRHFTSRSTKHSVYAHQRQKGWLFLRTAIAIVSYRIRRHFLCSSFNHWIGGNVDHKKQGGTNLFTMLLGLPSGSQCQVGHRNYESATTHFISDNPWAARDYTRQSAASQIPLVSTIVFSDRDNKLIICTAERNKSHHSTSSVSPFITMMMISLLDSGRKMSLVPHRPQLPVKLKYMKSDISAAIKDIRWWPKEGHVSPSLLIYTM